MIYKMATVRIVTDSTADLPANLVEEYGISVVPLEVFFGSQCYLDGIDLTTSEFYRRLASSKDLPTTSQPSPADFAKAYRPLLEEGAEVISIHISSEMSGTWQAAQLAKTALAKSDALEIIDSRTVSASLGMIVLSAARAAVAGRSKREIITLVNDLITDHQVYFMVDTLEYLQRGGRIGKAQALLGTILNVKPVCFIREGVIQPHEKVRGRKKAIHRLIEIISTNYQGGDPLFCYLAHGNDPEGLQYLHNLVEDKLNCAEIVYNQMGSVVGTHVGPGVLGLGVCSQKYMKN